MIIQFTKIYFYSFSRVHTVEMQSFGATALRELIVRAKKFYSVFWVDSTRSKTTKNELADSNAVAPTTGVGCNNTDANRSCTCKGGFLWLTWEADWGMRLSVVRVMGVPRGRNTLLAKAENRRRYQTAHAEYQKNKSDGEPSSLHA